MPLKRDREVVYFPGNEGLIESLAGEGEKKFRSKDESRGLRAVQNAFWLNDRSVLAFQTGV